MDVGLETAMLLVLVGLMVVVGLEMVVGATVVVARVVDATHTIGFRNFSWLRGFWISG